ncbi:MAG: gamma-glutamyltransferase [Solirubrobacterales bacterium]|nr:gamma-glutamyltransferase [Solirubrobacterales bacterium]MBV9916505.1 gamma-glutamyltransferase [Solirubrobacterales bacterium]
MTALREGGNSVDAAIAAGAVLTVTAPDQCGLGGDLLALVDRDGGSKPHALNASSRAGSGADPGRLRAPGRETMPIARDTAAASRGRARSAPS